MKSFFGVVAFVLLVEHLSTFLMLLTSIAGIDAGTLNGGGLPHLLPEPQMTVDDLELLWTFLGSVVVVGVALIFVFADMVLFRLRYVTAGLVLSGAHFVLMLIWIILGVTIYSQQHAPGYIYFSVFINKLQLQLLLGGIASCLLFLIVLNARNETRVTRIR